MSCNICNKYGCMGGCMDSVLNKPVAPFTEPVLGYDKEGKPIHEAKPGYVYTRAFILCRKCSGPIRACGGPSYGSICIHCHETLNKKAS